jgi:hypothetical protein
MGNEQSRSKEVTHSTPKPICNPEFRWGSCSVCGGPRGETGLSGNPGEEGWNGQLGPCGHKESRGRRGLWGPGPKIEQSTTNK